MDQEEILAEEVISKCKTLKQSKNGYLSRFCFVWRMQDLNLRGITPVDFLVRKKAEGIGFEPMWDCSRRFFGQRPTSLGLASQCRLRLRKWEDSNPRCPCEHPAFRVRSIRPLWHTSIYLIKS